MLTRRKPGHASRRRHRDIVCLYLVVRDIRGRPSRPSRHDRPNCPDIHGPNSGGDPNSHGRANCNSSRPNIRLISSATGQSVARCV